MWYVLCNDYTTVFIYLVYQIGFNMCWENLGFSWVFLANATLFQKKSKNATLQENPNSLTPDEFIAFCNLVERQEELNPIFKKYFNTFKFSE